MSKSSKKINRKQKQKVKQLMMGILLFLWFNFRTIIDYFIDSVFGWFYNGKEVRIPAISQKYLEDSAVNIAKSIQERKYTSEEVVTAYIDRIKQVNSIINAIADERFDEAIQEAKKIDEDIASGKISSETFVEKPFLGVPFTTKESTSCKGLSFTFGMISRKDIIGREDADVIKSIKNAGAILIANTNIPEFNLWQESRNNLFGMTLNPYNTTKTTGGSSGGEAALVASCGTAFGLGTDIGGSIRMPAFFCGVFGHKPTSYLISTKGLTKRTGQEKHTMVVAGPISRKAEDLGPILKVLLGNNVSKLRLDAPVDVTKLKYYYIEDPLDRKCSPVCGELKQIMEKVVNHFIDELSDDIEDQVQCLQNIEELQHCYRLWRYWMTQEPMKFMHEIANGEPINAWIELFKFLIGKSNFTFAVIIKMLDDVVLKKENEQWAQEVTTKLREKLLAILDKNGILFFPSFSYPAGHHYTPFLRPYNFSHCAIFNVLQFPVTQVPMGLSKDGMPLGIQVVAAPYNDHLCLAVAKHLEKNFGGYVTPF